MSEQRLNPDQFVGSVEPSRIRAQNFEDSLILSVAAQFLTFNQSGPPKVQRWNPEEHVVVDRLVQNWRVRQQSLESLLSKATPDLACRQEPLRFHMTFTFFLLFLVDESTCDAIVGDLEERFTLKLKMRAWTAHFWYWDQVFRSLPRLAWAALVKSLRATLVRTRQ
jgi:hypothetical protein